MIEKSQGWFCEQWNKYWETLIQDPSRKRGDSMRSLVIEKGEIRATVCGLDCEEAVIYAEPLSESEIEYILRDLGANRSFLFRIYQGTIDVEMLQAYDHRFGLEVPFLHMSCTCQDTAVPCGHLQLAASAVGEIFSNDLMQFLMFRGIEKGRIFAGLSEQDEPVESALATVDFGLIPLPARTSNVENWREKGPPTFWTSSFSFPQMMREIYGKVREEAKKK